MIAVLALSGCASAGLQKAAEKGDPQAQFTLAESYRRSDPALAFLWMKRAADQDYVKALVGLGKFYRDGTGVAGDPGAALACWEKAAIAFRDPEAAQLLLSALLPEIPPEKAELAVRCYHTLLHAPAVDSEMRKIFAAQSITEGDKLFTLLRSAGRRTELAAMRKRFTELFESSPQVFNLADPEVLEAMDRLSDENYVLPDLHGPRPQPPDTINLNPDFKALLAACDALHFNRLPALLDKARGDKEFENFLNSVPGLVVPFFFGKPELYRRITAGRSLYDFALFGSSIEAERLLDCYDSPFVTVGCRTSVQDGRGTFLFSRPGLLPLPADRYQEYGKAELYGVRIQFNHDRQFIERLEAVSQVAGELKETEHTYRIIFDSRPCIVKVTFPVYERIGGKLRVRVTDGSEPLRVELEELVPGSPEFRQWENYIAMNLVNGVFTWKRENAEHYLTKANAFERLKLKSYEKEPFKERVKREFRPGQSLEVVDIRREAILMKE